MHVKVYSAYVTTNICLCVWKVHNICTHTHIYIYIYTYICTHIYIYIYISLSKAIHFDWCPVLESRSCEPRRACSDQQLCERICSLAMPGVGKVEVFMGKTTRNERLSIATIVMNQQPGEWLTITFGWWINRCPFAIAGLMKTELTVIYHFWYLKSIDFLLPSSFLVV